MARLFVVVGPERSGTRMLTQTVINSGVSGCGEHEQEFVNKDLCDVAWNKVQGKGDVVVRFSIPHASKRPNLKEIWDKGREVFDSVIVMVILREPFYTAKSLERVWNGGKNEPWEHRNWLMDVLCNEQIPHKLVNYEAFCECDSYRQWLFGDVGLGEPVGEWRNANYGYK